MTSDKCPVCESPLERPRDPLDDVFYYSCPHCGHFGLTWYAEDQLGELLTTRRKRAVLSYAIRRTPRSGISGAKTIVFDHEECKRMVDRDDLPTPSEQADNLIRWLGDNLAGAGDTLWTTPFESTLPKIIGARSLEACRFLMEGLKDAGLLGGDFVNTTLSLNGWRRYDELKRGAPSGRNAFMAMQYGEERLDRIVNDYFRAAVGETGFVLRRLDDESIGPNHLAPASESLLARTARSIASSTVCPLQGFRR
jgi:hypothetical protein